MVGDSSKRGGRCILSCGGNGVDPDASLSCGSWMDLELLISRIRPEVKVIASEANNDVSVRDRDPRGSQRSTSFHPDLLRRSS